MVARKPVTSRQIAEELGIAQSTVSRALSGHPDVSEKTREQVRALAERLGYTPNMAARSLVQRRAGALGLLVQPNIPAQGTGYVYRVLREFAIYASRKGFNICVDFVRETSSDVTFSLHSGRVDGLVVAYASNTDRVVEAIQSMQLPMVLLRRRSSSQPGVAYVDTWDALGTQALIEHLYSLGHRRIAYVGTGTHPNEARVEGFLQGCTRFGLPAPNEWIIQSGDTMRRIEKIASVLRQPKPPTALVCYDDLNAVEIIRWCKSQGLNVPNDLSITGFGDEDFSSFINPALTTVRMPVDKLVHVAVDSIIEAIEQKQQPSIQEMFPVELVTRDSSGPPPSSVNPLLT